MQYFLAIFLANLLFVRSLLTNPKVHGKKAFQGQLSSQAMKKSFTLPISTALFAGNPQESNENKIEPKYLAALG
jgi:hypothetical protein